MELGILTVHGRIVHPQTQGKEESFNKSLTKECLKYNEITGIENAQKVFDEYRNVYNNIRPQHSLNLDVPAKHYQRSNTEYNPNIKKWEYPKKAEIRKVKETGFFNFANQGLFLSEAFANKEIAFLNHKKQIALICTSGTFTLAELTPKNAVLSLKKPI